MKRAVTRIIILGLFLSFNYSAFAWFWDVPEEPKAKTERKEKAPTRKTKKPTRKKRRSEREAKAERARYRKKVVAAKARLDNLEWEIEVVPLGADRSNKRLIKKDTLSFSNRKFSSAMTCTSGDCWIGQYASRR